ncbi:TIGR04282 family arsenosugar biosynthesis glycosyltransferase [Protaetiibacter mangrovi]|uniref:DUF2064 domain-containing protein n=1 Tax=Protaetiibacter mangrovi TaxID=2970926 RepID=A0ABT1ZC94_9MICO|nr:DUF2064 domain-containing protein [Protaetiibacter mangrovi]MCS0498327.1 DUF2064 domain-containing protein [Protaetiibacter mangrovi]TPX02377.1 DUF2064 domain-containing protein [Schumannella luteola]
MIDLVVIAKEPLPGRAKTRLHPPLSLEEAAELAAAAIDDTLAAVADVPAARRILLFDGARLPPRAAGYQVVPQSSGELDARLGAIFDELTAPCVLIGMDTPQVTAEHLAPAFDGWPDDVDAWFGAATDGGYWALGMRNPRGDLIRGVPMSRSDTGRHQLARLRGAGLRVGMLPTLTDVDTIDDAVSVARTAPDTAFARRLSELLASRDA